MTAKTDRTTLRRLPDRGDHNRETINAVLDAGLVCHVAFLHEERPAIIPTGYARVGDHLYLHGSRKNRALLATIGADCCVEVTLLDGIVLARSAFHHSFNYRSVVVYGRGEEVTDAAEKEQALERFVDQVTPGRAADCRLPNEKELRATLVIKVPLNEASAKIRSGPPKDDEADMGLPHWAGVMPVRDAWGPAEPDTEIALPEYLKDLQRS